MFIFRVILFIIFFSLPAFSSLTAQSVVDGEIPRFVLIHLDGVSSRYLQSEMEAGNLPNLEKTFGRHGIIEQAVTYFPSKTPTVISSLHTGTPGNESSLVSWAGINQETGEIYTGPQTFMHMIRSKSRLAVTNLLYGIPFLNWLAGPALGNLPDLLDDYRVLEFYWYPVDTAGHFSGEENYLRKLRDFDRDFEKMMRRLDEDVNIVIYSDHGMTFGTGIDVKAEVKEVTENRNTTISYPNLYIRDNEKAGEVAREVVDKTGIDYAFFRTGEDGVTGIHENGVIHIQSDPAGRLRYSYEGDDLFGYFSHGYGGESLTGSEWLEYTYNTEYPAAPVHIYNLLLNPGAGDILMLLNKSRYNRTGYSTSGNHGGITYQDITVPVLIRGPDVEHLYDRETLWLQELFPEIGTVMFRNTPHRDEHAVSWWYGPGSGRTTLRLSASLYYRWSAGAEATFAASPDTERFQTWIQFDFFRSYLARVWLAGGLEAAGSNVVPMVFLRHELRYRKLTARTVLSTTGTHEFALEFRLAEALSLQIVNFNSAGIRLHL